MEKIVKINDFVWAKITGFPPWPSIVVEPSANVPEQPNSEMHWIYFFGSHNYAWVEDNHLKPYNNYKEKYTSLYKTVLFKEAVEEIEDILDKLEKDPNYILPIKTFEIKKKNTSKRFNKSKIGNPKKRLKQASFNTEAGSSTSQFDLSYNVISTNDITTSDLSFGVLGIGIIGSRIVQNLIWSGHKVNIWNRTTIKCTDLENQLGASSNGLGRLKTFLNPRAVMQNSDIVLNCVSDCNVSKKIIQNYFGINNLSDKILKKKGFVEVTSIDPETSKDIRDMIEMKGGRYLEAQIQGSKSEAAEGKLVILAAGNRSLFFDCQSCFEAIGKSAYFLGDVGYATKINLILQLIKGICLAGFAEGFALAERCCIPFKELIKLFRITNLASDYLLGKADIISKNYNDVEQSLENMQKDMYLGLELSNKIGQPMELASVANEIFKHCRRFDLSDKDASSIYLRSRF